MWVEFVGELVLNKDVPNFFTFSGIGTDKFEMSAGF